MKKYIFFAGVIMCLVVIQHAHASNQGSVVINEIAWMGTTNSANDEWIELQNTTQTDIPITGWILQSADGKLKINLTKCTNKIIPAESFYLLERTDDSSVPNIHADCIYKGSLSNTGQNLQLYDSEHAIVDQVNYLAKWPAGNNATKQTMEKIPTGWQTSKHANGTPRAQNSIRVIGKTSTPGPVGKTNQNPEAETTSLIKDEKSSSKYVAAASQSNPGAQDVAVPGDPAVKNPWILFSLALGTAFLASIIIIIIKIKLTKTDVRS